MTPACLAPIAANAHSFGTPYVLPLPFWMYAYGCIATLIVTFALVGFFSRVATAHMKPPNSETSPGNSSLAVNRTGLWLLRAGAAGCLLLTLVAGLVGNTDPARNIAMTMFWVFFLLGFAYLTLFIGDLYALVNPWKLAVEGVQSLGLDLTVARVSFPRPLHSWPFLLYMALIWIELFLTPRPLTLSIALLIYTAITFVGVALFGKTTWFSKADLFGVFFRLIGKLAPLAYEETPAPTHWRVRSRLPFSGAINDRPEDMGLVLFTLFMLSSTTYDGIHDTTWWTGLFWKSQLWLLQPLWGTDLGKAQHLLMDWYLFYRQAGLVVLPFMYLSLYLLALLCTKALARTTVPLRTLVLDFCYPLLPIALAYNVTHYFTFVVVQWQQLLWLISDPFGFGWDLLGVAATAKPKQPSMGLIWHVQVALLLLGHLVSIYLVHLVSMRTFAERRPVICQLPLLLLMIVYTVLGLWILSLPLAAE
jgi:hypothetical protein